MIFFNIVAQMNNERTTRSSKVFFTRTLWTWVGNGAFRIPEFVFLSGKNINAILLSTNFVECFWYAWRNFFQMFMRCFVLRCPNRCTPLAYEFYLHQKNGITIGFIALISINGSVQILLRRIQIRRHSNTIEYDHGIFSC